MDGLRTIVIEQDEFRRMRKLDLPELIAAMHALNADVAISADDKTLQIVV